jgi:hypothetical protein
MISSELPSAYASWLLIAEMEAPSAWIKRESLVKKEERPVSTGDTGRGCMVLSVAEFSRV